MEKQFLGEHDGYLISRFFESDIIRFYDLFKENWRDEIEKVKVPSMIYEFSRFESPEFFISWRLELPNFVYLPYVSLEGSFESWVLPDRKPKIREDSLEGEINRVKKEVENKSRGCYRAISSGRPVVRSFKDSEFFDSLVSVERAAVNKVLRWSKSDLTANFRSQNEEWLKQLYAARLRYRSPSFLRSEIDSLLID